jgi:hypothetical protein
MGFYIEGSPGFPPVRIYLNVDGWNAYEGHGFFTGSDTELGVKGSFRGFSLFAGWRWEDFSGRAEHNVLTQSRLKFRVEGPILGLGVSF